MDLGSQYPDSEDIREAFDREFGTLMSAVSNIQFLFKRIMEGQTYLDDNEVAQLLHCKPNEIPVAIPKYRGSRQGYLYKRQEIEDFLESKRIPKRN